MNFIRIPPSERVTIISETVAIILVMPPRERSALTEASLVWATKPSVINPVSDFNDSCGF